MTTSRRTFLMHASRAALAAPLAASAPFAFANKKPSSASDKITVALIGANSMGFEDLKDALKQPGVQCAAICDVDASVLAKRIADVNTIQGHAPSGYSDFRKVIERKDIDAVIIGTPDHWHCLPLIYACEAGKDVYVEKPMGNSIGECDAMVAATRKYKRVVQVGQQQRSGPHWQHAISHIREGKIGQLRKVQIWANFNYGIGEPIVADEPVPAGVDFDMWLGPAPMRSFNKTRFHGSWRMFWDYGGGLMTDWGVHLIDMALWALDIKEPPDMVMAAGGNIAYKDHAHETFDTMSVVFQAKEHAINWEHTAGTQNGPYGRLYGLAFVGNDATLVIDRDSWEIYPEVENGNYKVPMVPKQRSADMHQTHLQNWVECIRSRQDPACTVENGRLVATYAHMANISLRTKSALQWDAANRNFGTNKAANALLTAAYRAPWSLPKI